MGLLIFPFRIKGVGAKGQSYIGRLAENVFQESYLSVVYFDKKFFMIS